MDAPLPSGLNEAWAELFLSENLRDVGLGSYDRIFADGTLFPLQRRREMEKMMSIAESYSPRVVYEIGTDKGGGLYHWCKSLATVEQVIACEIRGTPFRELFEEAFPRIDFLWLPESSYDEDAIRKVTDWVRSPIDVLFIDGDKNNFDRDFFAYQALLADPGVVFFHDIQDESTNHGYQTVLRSVSHGHEEIIDVTESVKSAKRALGGVPVSTSYEAWLRHWCGESCGVGVLRIGDEPCER